MTDRPEAAEDLEVVETDDGLVIYQGSRDRVHHLNNTAAVVLELCDGQREVAAIAEELAALFALDHPPQEEVEACVHALVREGLVH